MLGVCQVVFKRIERKDRKMKLSELEKNMQFVEAKRFLDSEDRWVDFGEYRIKIADKKYAIYLLKERQSFSIERCEIKNTESFSAIATKSIIQSREMLSKYGFIDDLEAPKESESVEAKKIKCLNPKCDFECMAVVNRVGFVGCGIHQCPVCGSEMSSPFNHSKKKEKEAPSEDLVNNPSHYKRGEIECIDALESSMTKKKVYVASPIAHYFKVYGSAMGLKFARRHAMELSKEVKKLGHIPISAPLMFLGVYDEPEERELAMCAGFMILASCNAFAYRECDLLLSKGIQEELEEAKLRKMEVIEL